jgi:hypothetical protein
VIGLDNDEIFETLMQYCQCLGIRYQSPEALRRIALRSASSAEAVKMLKMAIATMQADRKDFLELGHIEKVFSLSGQ